MPVSATYGPDELTPKQAARLLKTHIATVYRLVMKGKLPARKIGGRTYRIRKQDVLARVASVLPTMESA